MLFDNRPRNRELESLELKRDYNSLPFNPQAYNPIIWLDATDASAKILNGTDVITDLDKSGNTIDYTQITAAQRPVIDDASNPTEIVFNSANSEFLQNTADINKLALLNRGSIVFIVKNFSGPVVFGAANSTSNFNYIQLGSKNSSKATMIINNGVKQTFITGSTTIVNGMIVEFYSTGSAYGIRINGVEEALSLTSGVNDGFWFNKIPNLDNSSIAKLGRLSSFYGSMSHTHLSIYSTQLDQTQSYNLTNYLIDKHNL